MAPRRRGKLEVNRELGRHYGKFDLDRVGLFDDEPAGPFGKYVITVPITRTDVKGKRQLLAGQPNDYIDKVFKRIFDGEALQAPRRTSKKVVANAGGRPMLPPSGTKLHSTPNDWFGCIGKPPPYFSPAVKKTNEKKIKGILNFKIKPNPLGGPGYVDICINPYPKHPSEPYDAEEKKKKGGKLERLLPTGKFLIASAPLDYFPPNPYVDLKRGPTYVRPKSKVYYKIPPGNEAGRFYVPFPKSPGGHHAGCINKFPVHTGGPYHDRKFVLGDSGSKGLKFLAGGPASRSKYTNNIIDQVTGVSCNAKNYREYRERVYPLPH